LLRAAVGLADTMNLWNSNATAELEKTIGQVHGLFSTTARRVVEEKNLVAARAGLLKMGPSSSSLKRASTLSA